MRAAASVVHRAAAGFGALGVHVGRVSGVYNLSSRSSVYPLVQSVRYASTVPTSTTTSAETGNTQHNNNGASADGASGDEEAELQRLQALIKEKLAKQKERLLEQLSPLPGEQTSGFKRRTRAQREAERSAPAATADSGNSQRHEEVEAGEQNDQPWQQLGSPLPLRKPAYIQSNPTSTPAFTPQQPRRLTTPRTSRTSQSTARPDDSYSSQSASASADSNTMDEPAYTRRTRTNDPNLNPERQAMLHDRNTRKDEQKRIKVQRRLQRDETERVTRQDDELFHDVTSPRQKLRGKGIAGSAVLAKHQRHTKGVREEDEGSVEQRMSRSVFARETPAAEEPGGGDKMDAERDRNRRQLKYAERGERGSRQEWAGAGKPGRWEAREQRWQSGRRTGGRVRRVGEEHVGAQRARGHGVDSHPYGKSVAKPDGPGYARSRTYSREEPRRAAPRQDYDRPRTYSREQPRCSSERGDSRGEPRRSMDRRDSTQSKEKGQFSWVTDMKQHASSMQHDRQERDAKRDRGNYKGRR